MLRDYFESDVALSIEEASGEVDGNHILGKVKGTFFVPDGTSRNNRYYPRDLWEKVCKDPSVVSRLKEKRMLGTIGHEQRIDDDAVLNGKISHIVTTLQVEGNRGVGEALILDTLAGRALNTLIRAGSKLFVSSRADGTFKGERNGIPMVDPETYTLTTFDFVVDPGFLQANPALVEALNNIQSNTIQGDSDMSEKVIERIAEENGRIKGDLTKAADENVSLKNENTILVDSNKKLKFASDKAQTELKALRATVESHRKNGSAAEMTKVLEVAEKNRKELFEFRKLGKSPRDVERALDAGIKLAERVKKIGSSVGEIEEALDKSTAVVKIYKDEFGTIPEVRKCFDKFESIKKKSVKESADRRVEKLSDLLNVSADKIRKLVSKKMTDDEIKEVYKGVNEQSRIATTYRKTGSVNESGRVADKKDGNSPLFEMSRVDRLLTSL